MKCSSTHSFFTCVLCSTKTTFIRHLHSHNTSNNSQKSNDRGFLPGEDADCNLFPFTSSLSSGSVQDSSPHMQGYTTPDITEFLLKSQFPVRLRISSTKIHKLCTVNIALAEMRQNCKQKDKNTPASTSYPLSLQTLIGCCTEKLHEK